MFVLMAAVAEVVDAIAKITRDSCIVCEHLRFPPGIGCPGTVDMVEAG